MSKRRCNRVSFSTLLLLNGSKILNLADERNFAINFKKKLLTPQKEKKTSKKLDLFTCLATTLLATTLQLMFVGTITVLRKFTWFDKIFLIYLLFCHPLIYYVVHSLLVTTSLYVFYLTNWFMAMVSCIAHMNLGITTSYVIYLAASIFLHLVYWNLGCSFAIWFWDRFLQSSLPPPPQFVLTSLEFFWFAFLWKIMTLPDANSSVTNEKNCFCFFLKFCLQQKFFCTCA